MTFAAYLLDPVTATIRTVTINRINTLNDFYRFIDCQYVATVEVDADHIAFIDDEAMMQPIAAMWRLKGSSAAPLAGRSIIVRALEDGTSDSPTIPLAEMADKFLAYRPVIFPEILDTIPDQICDHGFNIHGAVIGGFHLRLIESPISATGAA